MKKRLGFAELLDFHRRNLLDDVAPFWMKHALDCEHGGINTCIRDDGSPVSDDKYLWSQLRAIWTFSKLYNRIERRQEWLDAARNIYEFARRVGRDEQGRWVFLVDRDGRVMEGAKSIYADGFAIYGLTEFARATGDEAPLRLALETYENVQARLRSGDFLTAPYEIPPGGKVHGVSMIFSIVFHELAQYTGRKDIQEAALHHSREVMDHFRRPARELLFEYIRLDNGPLDGPAGRCVVPGHAIESMWFQMHIFRDLGMEARIPEAVECIRWHVERGWDPEYGGIFLGLDAEGKEPVYWANAEKKAWWPATEALYALLLAYEYAREGWCLDWYWRVHDWSFAHFPVKGHGEWTQRLDRQGRPVTQVLALPVKDPFHLPRALIYLVDVLERLAAKGG